MRITRKTHPVYFEWPHAALSALDKLVGFYVNDEEYAKHRREAEEACSGLTDDEKDAWAAHVARTHPGFHSQPIASRRSDDVLGAVDRLLQLTEDHHLRHFRVSIANLILLGAVLILLLLLLARSAKAEPGVVRIRASDGHYVLIRTEGLFPQVVGSRYPFGFDASNNLKVNCITGCSASSGFTDNTLFTVGTSSINVIGAYFTSGADPAITSGNAGRLRMDASSNLRVNCIVGCAGGSTTPADAFANPTTAGLQFDLLAGFNGTTWDRLRSSIANGLQVDVTRVQGTVTVGGTVTSNIGTTGGLALDATVSSVQPRRLQDGSGSTLATVKAGSTAPAATDTSVVVSLSQNAGLGSSSTPMRIDPTGTTVQPISAASLPLPSGAATSANQPPLAADNSANSSSKNPVLPCRANTANPSWTDSNQVPCSVDLSGNQRFLMNSWLGSTAPSVGQKTSANSIPVVPASDWVDTATGNKSDNGAAAGANRIAVLPAIIQTTPGNGAAGTQGRDAAMEKGTDGLAWMASLPARRPCSYYASTGTVGVTTAATATDIAVITGNATTDVLVTKIKVSATQTTAGNVPIQIIRRSSADTSGTETNLTIGKDEPNCGASSIAAAGVGVYTANPTLGTLDSIPDSYALGVMAPGTATANDIFILNRQQKPIVLVGTAQQLAVNICSNSVQACTGTTVTGGVFRITFEWEEVTHITP